MVVCTRRLLEEIRTPADVRALAPEELHALAGEMRAYLLDWIPRVGGHFASNLGTVELAIALHKVFESPKDAIVWDVSHGAYPHKLLTGRAEALPTLRRHGGLSGFLSPFESEHDVAATGHAGTALSTALGMAWARERLGIEGRVVTVVGDGSIGSGPSLEALNSVLNRDLTDLRLTVVLNDNEWSIDPTPGGIARILASARKKVLGGRFFEELGLRYIGPIDGHDLDLLVEVFRETRAIRKPVLIHVLTVKGKGCPEAEEDPLRYHALSPPTAKAAGPTFTEVFAAELLELARADRRIVALTAGMESGTGLKILRRELPDRVIDMGIAEAHTVTFAAGLAIQGLRPVAAIYSTFLQRAYDHIVHDICLPGLPVVFAVDRAGCVGPDGPTHHGVFDIAYLRHLPRMKVLAPSNAQDLRNHLRAALAAPGPTAIRWPRAAAPESPVELTSAQPFGTSRRVRDGDRAAILVTGAMVPVALEAAELLSARGLELEVLEFPSIKPLDRAALIDAASRHPALFTLEDHVVSGGFGSAVCEALSGMPHPPLELLGWPDSFIEHGSIEDLRKKYGLDPQGVAQGIEEFLNGLEEGPNPAAPAAILKGRSLLGGTGLPELPQVDPERAAALMEKVRETKLSATVEDFARRYERIGRRDVFLWRWVQRGIELTALPCVAEALASHVRDTKILGVMLDVLLDDVADAAQDVEFLEELLARLEGRPAGGTRLSLKERCYLEFTETVWRTIWERARSYPRYGEFEELLRYDYRQLFNVMRYSALVNRRPEYMNLTEHDLYLPHNMHMIVSGTLDLMASPSFDARETGALRAVLWRAQRMGRIGNMITTWEREIGDRDFTSGVFAYAFETGILSPKEAAGLPSEEIRTRLREADLERRFLAEWSLLRAEILALAHRIRSVDVHQLAGGLERLIQIHLASRGLK